jgi:hypothetical protein
MCRKLVAPKGDQVGLEAPPLRVGVTMRNPRLIPSAGLSSGPLHTAQRRSGAGEPSNSPRPKYQGSWTER